MEEFQAWLLQNIGSIALLVVYILMHIFKSKSYKNSNASLIDMFIKALDSMKESIEENTEKRDKRVNQIQSSQQKQIEELKAATVNIEKFIAIANKYTDLQELTAEVLRTFVAKIVIHERTTKWAKTSEQQIDIYFRYIGCLEERNTKQAV